MSPDSFDQSWDYWCSQAGLRSERLSEVEHMVSEWQSGNGFTVYTDWQDDAMTRIADMLPKRRQR